MNRPAFYAALRARNSGVFGTSLSNRQVEAMDAILDAGAHLPLSHLAYTLATAYGETGMDATKTENMNYRASRIAEVFSEGRRQGKTPDELAGRPELLANTVYGGPWGSRNLGNTEPGDGWKFRGQGLPQTTGRANAEKIKRLTGLDVVNNPALMLTPAVGARSLVAAIEHGIYTGKKASDYLPGDYVNARRIINGTFDAQKYAGYARAFEAALTAAGYVAQTLPIIATLPPRPVVGQPLASNPVDVSRPPKSDRQSPLDRIGAFLAALVSRLFSFLGKGGSA